MREGGGRDREADRQRQRDRDRDRDTERDREAETERDRDRETETKGQYLPASPESRRRLGPEDEQLSSPVRHVHHAARHRRVLDLAHRAQLHPADVPPSRLRPGPPAVRIRSLLAVEDSAVAKDDHLLQSGRLLARGQARLRARVGQAAAREGQVLVRAGVAGEPLLAGARQIIQLSTHSLTHSLTRELSEFARERKTAVYICL